MPRLSKTIEEWNKEDPPPKKKFTVVIYVPECLAGLGTEKDATEVVKVVGYYTSIAFYNFLRVGEYTVKV